MVIARSGGAPERRRSTGGPPPGRYGPGECQAAGARSGRGRPALWLALLAAGLSGVACQDTGTGPSAGEYEIRVIDGDAQTGGAADTLPDPLRVRVTDRGTDEPVQGVPIAWRMVGEAAGSVVPAAVLTDDQGRASARVVLGEALGEYSIVAATNSLFGRAAEFSAHAVRAPSIRSIEPAAAVAGDTILIRGERLESSGIQTDVLFDGIRGRLVEIGPTELRVEVPDCVPTRTATVRVLLGGVASASETLAVTGAARTPIRMRVGEVRSLGPAEFGCVELPTASDEGYLLVAQNATPGADLGMHFELTGLTGSAPAATVDRSRARETAARARRTADPLGWEARRRTLESEIAGEDLIRPDARRQPDLGPQATPAVGDERRFAVFDHEESFDTVTARVRYVSQRTVLYEDVEAPAGGFEDRHFERFGALFDDPIHDAVVDAFGEPSDIDENGRIIVLFTPRVNALTDPQTEDAFVAGFFFGHDLTDRPGSNRAEIFYSLVPDRLGEHGGQRSTSEIFDAVPPVLAHEFQHMVHFNQRVLLRGANGNDALWLAEGLAHMAEELVAERFAEDGDGELVETFRLPNLLRAHHYLVDPAAESVVSTGGSGSLELRGAAWLLVQFLAGHFDGENVLRSLTQTTRSGIENVVAATGEDWADLFARWSTALWADAAEEVGVPVDPAYTFPNIELRSEFDRWMGVEHPVRPDVYGFEDLHRGGALPAATADYVVVAADGPAPPYNLSLASRWGRPFGDDRAPRLTLLRIR